MPGRPLTKPGPRGASPILKTRSVPANPRPVPVAERDALQSSPAVLKALAAAEKRYNDLVARGDVPQSLVDRAKDNWDSLCESLDSSTFDAADALLVGSYQAHKQGKINALREQIAQSERELGLVKSDQQPEPPAEATTGEPQQ